MFLNEVNGLQRTLIIVLAITCILGVLILYCPPALFPDPSWGFQVMRSMQLGGGFNLNIIPDPGNIAKDTSGFLTWWSPGQYLLPYAFTKALGLNTGHAAALSVLFCDVSGILGFYCFFMKIGFEQRVSALSVAFIVSQQFFFIPFVFYNGGETLLFGFLGWFLYGCFSFEKVTWKTLLFVLLSGWIGFFCKSAFLWMYAAGMLCLWITLSNQTKQMATWIRNGVWIAIPALIALLTLYKFYLSKGTNPATASAGLHFSLTAFGFPLASPLLSGFSMDDLFHGLIFHQDEPLVSPGMAVLVLLLMAAISVALYAAFIRRMPNTKYKIVVSAFYGVSVLFFFSVYLRQLDISYEARHFRIVGLLFAPGTVYFFTRSKIINNVLFRVFWAGIIFSSAWYFTVNYKYNATVSAHGPSGMSQLFIDQPTLDYLHGLDSYYKGDAIFVFTSTDLGLEIVRNRMVTLDAPDENSKSSYVADNEHDGHAGPLFLMLPAYSVKNGNVKLVEQSFPAYKNFSVKFATKNYVVIGSL